MISHASCFTRIENESSLSLTNFPPIWTVICQVSIWMFQFGIGLAVHLSTAEFNSRLGFRASWTPVEVIDYIAKWWQIKSCLVCVIFTPQCLVSRYNLAKIDPIIIKSKQLYSPHFGIRCIVWWRTQNILSGNKGEIDSGRRFTDIMFPRTKSCKTWRLEGDQN